MGSNLITMERNFIRMAAPTVTLKTGNFNIAMASNDNGLDVIDLLILKYINKLILFCRPASDDEPHPMHYVNVGNQLFTEVHEIEFLHMYPIAELAGVQDFNNYFWNKIDKLVNLRLLEMVEDNYYRTSGLYADWLNN